MNVSPLRSATVALTALLLLSSSSADAQRKKRVVTVGVVVDGNAEGDVLLARIIEQAKSLAGADFELRFPDNKRLVGDFDATKIGAHLDTLLRDGSVNVVLAYGIVAGNIAGTRKALSKPVLAPFVLDRKLQKLPYDKGKSGRKNLSYIEFPWSIPRDLEVFREVTRTDTVAFIVDQYMLDAVPGLAEQAKAIAKESNVALEVYGVSGSADKLLASLPANTRAAYLTPLFHLPLAERAKIHAGLTARKVATYSIQGELEVRAGVLVGRRPASSFEKIARRVSLNVVRVAGGRAAESLPVSLSLPERLMINMRTARAIGLSPTWRVLTEADLIDVDVKKAARKVDLKSVMVEALAGNLNIKALEASLRAAEAEVQSAKSSLLPRLDASSTAQAIDSDRATFTPQYLWSGSVSATQVLWSEQAWAGLSVTKLAQRAKEHELGTTRLDVVGDVATAYLNVVRAKTAERIQRQNLTATRANLETARTQFEAGATSRADVYRWQSQIALDRKSLIEAAARRNISEIALQRILNRPPEERYETSDELKSKQAIGLIAGIKDFIGDPWTFRLFREFALAEAMANSPELRQVDAAIAVQERLETSAKRQIYSPTVSLTGSVTQRFFRGGAGSDAVPGEKNGTDWFAGLTISIPLYDGGRYAEVERNTAEVVRLRAERKNLADGIAQRSASALHQMGASYASIGLSRDSADAAKKNYDLVAEAYAQGATRIVDVIDAQNAWFSADRLAADSVYAFLIDWMAVQRSIGAYTILMSVADRREFAQRARTFITKRRNAAAGKGN